MEKLETPYVISPHRKSRHPPHIGQPVVMIYKLSQAPTIIKQSRPIMVEVKAGRVWLINPSVTMPIVEI